MLVIGLTGGIATGKSTVSKILSQAPYYLTIIDADVLARRVVEPGTRGYDQILAHFSSRSPDLLLTSSNDTNHDKSKGAPLDRAALGRLVFGESDECRKNRLVLNNIVHPAVRREMIKEVLKAYVQGHWAVVLDVPLLFESGLDVICATVMVVAVRDPKIQMRRLIHRDSHLTEADAENRIHSQENLQEKVAKCRNRGKGRGLIIYNDGDLHELKKEVQQVMFEVRNGNPQWWTWLLWCCPPLAGLVGIWHYGKALLINLWWSHKKPQAKAYH